MGFGFYPTVFLSTEQPRFKAPGPNMASYSSSESTTLHCFFRARPGLELCDDVSILWRILSRIYVRTLCRSATNYGQWGARAAGRIPRTENRQRRAEDKLERGKGASDSRARCLSQGQGSDHEDSQPSRYDCHREGQMKTDRQTVSLRREGAAGQAWKRTGGWLWIQWDTGLMGYEFLTGKTPRYQMTVKPQWSWRAKELEAKDISSPSFQWFLLLHWRSRILIAPKVERNFFVFCSSAHTADRIKLKTEV